MADARDLAGPDRVGFVRVQAALRPSGPGRNRLGGSLERRGRPPTALELWEREALAYKRDVVQVWAQEQIVVPECLLIDRGVDHVDLWLEDVDGLPGERWGLDDYASAARALGAAQGRVARFGGPANLPFLSRSFLRDYSSEKPVDWDLLHSDAAWADPLVSRNVPGQLREGAIRLHANRERLDAVAEALPPAICHLDFWTKNLFRRGDEIVVVDWATVGDGALGEDIGNLIPDAVFDHFVPAAQLPDLETAVYDAYLDGVRAAGWSDDPRLVQLGLWASSIKYDWLTPAMLSSANADQHLAYGGARQVKADYRFHERGVALLRLTGWADQALALASHLGP